MTLIQVEANPFAVTSQLSFHSCPFYASIDFSVTYSFIAQRIIEKLTLTWRCSIEIKY